MAILNLEYIVRYVYGGIYSFKRFIIPRVFEILHAKLFIRVFHCNLFCRLIPRNVKESVSFSGMLSVLIERELKLLVVFLKTMSCDFITLSDSLLTFSHAVIFLISKVIA